MEVTLLDAGSLPKGCLLSVKAGTTRRQAPVDSESFRLAFPKYAPNSSAANLLKVDLLAAVGTATLNLDEAQDSYKVELPGLDGQLLAFELGIRSGGDKTMENASTTEKVPGVFLDNDVITKDTTESASRRHRLAVNARRYLDEHGLMSWAQSLFQDIIHQQPEDPWAFIDEKSQEARQSHAAKAEEPTSGPDLAVVGTSMQDMDELRQAACTSLMKAATGGQLEKVLGDVKRDLTVPPDSDEAPPVEEPQDWDDLKAKSLRALSNIFDGPEDEGQPTEEDEAAAEPEDIEVAPSVAQALGEWHSEAKEPSPEAATEEELEALRQEAMVTLSTAAAEGSLQELLMKSSAEKVQGAEARGGGDVPVEDLRQQAQGALCEAMQSGKLKEVLSRSGTRDVAADLLQVEQEEEKEAEEEQKQPDEADEISTLRNQARDALAKAVEAGTLQEVLEARFATEGLEEEEEQEEDIDALREEAREALSRAITNGGLEDVLASNQASSTKSRARDALEAGSMNGQLEELLSRQKDEAAEDPAQSEAEIEALRLAAQKTFGSAVADGRLSTVLGDSRRSAELAHAAAEALAEAEAEAEAEGQGSAPPAAAEGEAAAAAAAGGAEASSPEELEELRLRIRTAMSAASETNELEDILAKTKAKEAATSAPGAEAEAEAEVLDAEASPPPPPPPPPPAESETEREANGAEAKAEAEDGDSSGGGGAGASTPPELKEVRADIRSLQAWTDKTREELSQIQESAKGELQHICEQARETGDLLTELRDHTLSLRATALPEAPASSTAVETLKPEQETALVVEDVQDDKEEAAFPEGVTSSLANASELVAELESKLRTKNEIFRQENEALRKENERLKNLRQLGEATKDLGDQNAALREA